MATGLQYADGMVWAREGFLAFADVSKKKIYRLDPGSLRKPSRGRQQRRAGARLRYAGRGCTSASRTSRRVIRLDRRGKIETLVDRFEGKKFNSPNDMVVRHDGQVYFTDPAFGSAADHAGTGFQRRVSCRARKARSRRLRDGRRVRTGSRLSGDGKTLYVGDADRHAVVAFDVDGHGAASQCARSDSRTSRECRTASEPM